MLKIDHLIGKPFQLGKQDCFTLARDFYADNFGVQIKNYARPTDFWIYGMNPYLEHFKKEGFKVVEVATADLQIGDGLLMAIRAREVNHAAVVVGPDRILHHCYGQLSKVEEYRGLWRNKTMAVLRHPDVKYTPPPSETMELLELLPPHVRQRYLEAVSESRAREGGVHSG